MPKIPPLASSIINIKLQKHKRLNPSHTSESSSVHSLHIWFGRSCTCARSLVQEGRLGLDQSAMSIWKAVPVHEHHLCLELTHSNFPSLSISLFQSGGLSNDYGSLTKSVNLNISRT